MIRFLIYMSIFILSSCGRIEYSYFTLFKEGFSKSKIELNEEYLKNQKYSFIKIKYSGNEAVFVLRDVTNYVHTWVGSNYEKILTYKGKIIKSEGFGLDYSVSDFSFENLQKAFPVEDFIFSFSILEPEINHLEVNYKKYQISNYRNCDVYREFSRDNALLKWKENDVFCYANSSLIWTRQQLSPIHDNIYIEFHYRY